MVGFIESFERDISVCKTIICLDVYRFVLLRIVVFDFSPSSGIQ